MIRIRTMVAGDWPAVEAIYAEGIATRAATFETEPPDYDAFDASHHPEHRLVGTRQAFRFTSASGSVSSAASSGSRSSTASGATPSCSNSACRA